MIKHIVMWSVKGDSEAERARHATQVRDAFNRLIGKVDGLIELEVGIDQSRVDYACDVVLYSVFESQRALDDYAVHPEHLRIRQELEGIRVRRHQVDYSRLGAN